MPPFRSSPCTATVLAAVSLFVAPALAQPAPETAADTEGEPVPAPATPAATTPAAVPVVAAPDATEKQTEAARPAKGPVDEKAGWQWEVFGTAALNVIHDSTQGVGEGLNNNILPRPGSYRSEHDQTQFSARDSRLGMTVRLPHVSGVELSARAEVDFRGITYPEVTENDLYIFGPIRMRYFYSEAKTPVVDILAGQYDDLFGWGGAGFYPNTLAYLGVTGQIFHRQPQLRITREQPLGPIELDVAAALARPVQRRSGVPDLQGGLKLELDGWKGARTPGYGKTDVGPLALGFSGIYRRLEPVEFLAEPGDSVGDWAWGYAFNAMIPVIPASNKDDVGNALTLTAEYSNGTGIADMYTELTGGVLFPTIPNLQGDPIPPLYNPDMDPGIATFDGEGRLRTVNWKAFVVGVQYYLPVMKGRISISGIYSRLQSNNAAALTPVPFRQAVYDKAEYIDGNLFIRLTENYRIAGSFQTVKQTFSDRVETRNNRIQGAVHLFF
jgi:hypothetical protein